MNLKFKPGFVLALVVFLAAGCDFDLGSFPYLFSRKNSEVTVTPVSTPTPAPTVELTPTVVAPPVLSVWLPPALNPYSGTTAGNLLAERLESFRGENPGVQIQVRIKEMSGAGGMMDSLGSAYAAASDALPAVVALPRSEMEMAALKGILVPLDGLSQEMAAEDWYPYARDLATIQDSLYGLPFGGDTLVLIYRTEKFGSHPNLTWQDVFRFGQPVLFAAAENRAYLTITLYQSIGGPLEDESKRPVIQPEILGRTLDLYTSGMQQGIFPSWATGFDSDQAVLESYRAQNAHLAITMFSTYATTMDADTSVAPLPGLGGSSYSLMNAWAWSVADPNPERRLLSIKLAEHLSKTEFLVNWVPAAGLLPTRSSVVQAMLENPMQPFYDTIALSGHLLPANDVLTSQSPVLRDATLQVIRQQIDPMQVAQSAADRLNTAQTK